MFLFCGIWKTTVFLVTPHNFNSFYLLLVALKTKLYYINAISLTDNGRSL